MKQKSVQTGVLWVAIVGIAVLFLCLGGYYFYQSSQISKQAEAAKKERSGLVARLLSVSVEKYSTPVMDNSAWDALYEAVQQKDINAIDECVGYMPETYKASCVAVFGADGSLIYDNCIDSLPSRGGYPFEGEALVQFFSAPDNYTFTINKDNRLFNCTGAGIVPTYDEYTRNVPPAGYLMLIREVLQEDIQKHCKSLGDIDAAIFTDEQHKNAYIASLSDVDYIESTMRSNTGEVSAYLCFSYPFAEKDMLREFGRVFNFVCVEVILIFVFLMFYVNKRITRPLRNIGSAFSVEQIDLLSSISQKNKNNEFGQIADMMMSFFEQKEEITMQNETLMQQTEEISMQNETLMQQTEEISMQNECMLDLNNSLALANKNMTDSISYASRLQRSMLLAHAPHEGWFDEGFALYRPKDIVGGDFYLCQSTKGHNIAILGDCTGHGVPGAILASMGISFIFQIIDANDFDYMPDTLLNRLRTKVIAAFAVEEGDKSIDDGMDIAVVIQDTNTGVSYFSGAGRPAVIVSDGELRVVKGDRMPIGRYVRTDNFTRVNLDLRAGDTVYIYSDGCTDQVGGPMNRKINTKPFQAHLLKASALEFSLQKEYIENFIDTWRGNSVQVDDISLLAFRV